MPGSKGAPGPGRLPGKGLSKYIRDQSRDGFELAEWCFRVLRGHDKTANAQDKRFAVEWLSNRGFGKAPEVNLIGELAEGDNPLAEIPSARLKALLLSDNAPEGGDASTLPAESAPPAADVAPGATITALPLPPPPPEKCPACGLRRAHNLDCPERPKPLP